MLINKVSNLFVKLATENFSAQALISTGSKSEALKPLMASAKLAVLFGKK